MKKKANKVDVKSVTGLQGLLTETVEELFSLEERDQPWVRLGISSVNSGNSLLRTEMKLRAERRKAEREAV